MRIALTVVALLLSACAGTPAPTSSVRSEPVFNEAPTTGSNIRKRSSPKPQQPAQADGAEKPQQGSSESQPSAR